MPEFRIRQEQPGDEEQIAAVVTAAFPTAAEAHLVNRLRGNCKFYLSLVAMTEDKIVGHILLTETMLENHEQRLLVGLAPLSVSPAFQGKGLGSKLIAGALDKCRLLEVDAVFVLGNPEFYGRFEFGTAALHGLHSTYPLEEKYFMLLILNETAMRNISGTVKYHAAFDQL